MTAMVIAPAAPGADPVLRHGRMIASTTTAPPPAHPARFPDRIMNVLAGLVDEHQLQRARVIDPFCGTGRTHDLGLDSTGVEIEPEWAGSHPQTIVGDATALPFPAGSFDAAITSPCYSNRLADHHEAKDGSYRRTYRHLLGRPLTAGSAGAMQWGDAYRDLHRRAWRELHRVLVPGGLVLLNVKNHVRRGQEVRVVEWHLQHLVGHGFDLVEEMSVSTAGSRYGANRDLRIGHEVIAVLRRDQSTHEVERA